MAGTILVGTASWTDPGFIADWYPRKLPAADRLRYYAERFQMVEVNSSFYAIPGQALVERWCEQTPPGFIFDVKLHRLLSRHSTTLANLPPALRPLAKIERDRVQLTPALEKALTEAFLRELKPLAEAGKLGALLLQLTPAFGPDQHQLEELEGLLQALAGYQIAVELRNRHWLAQDRVQETLKFFRQHQVTWVTVDAPVGEHFMTMPSLDVVTHPPLAYMRLHGRNLQGYLTGRTVAERFDYFYSNDELAEIAQRAVKLADQAAQTHVVYNNNASDYPLRNAATFQQILTRNHPETRPARPPVNPVTEPEPARTLEFDFALPAAPTKKGRAKR